MPVDGPITVFAPASVANVGPCYDLMGYALDYVGDFVSVKKTNKMTEPLIWGGVSGPRAADLADVRPEDNVAWVVAQHLLNDFVSSPLDFSIELSLHKYLPVASGLGSSAATGVATVKALLELLSLELKTPELVRALELGEQHTSGTAHPDNVVPSFYGGFWFMCPRYEDTGTDGMMYRLDGADHLLSVVIKSKAARIMTKEARQRVRKYIRERYMSSETEPAEVLDFASLTAAKAADMVHSVHTGDLRRIGWILSHNEHLEAARGPLIPNFPEVKSAALSAGAFGCTISGSGPSIVAVTDNHRDARAIRDAMLKAIRSDSWWLVSPIGQSGARRIDSVSTFVDSAKEHTNFMES